MSIDRVQPSTDRRTYSKPKLKAFGHVIALTAGGTATPAENGGGMKV